MPSFIGREFLKDLVADPKPGGAVGAWHGLDDHKTGGASLLGASDERPFIGRVREPRPLDGLVASVEGGGAAAAFAGETGIGKTTLLTQVAKVESKRPDVRIHRARGVESEAVRAFAATADLLLSLRERLAELPQAQRQAHEGRLARASVQLASPPVTCTGSARRASARCRRYAAAIHLVRPSPRPGLVRRKHVGHPIAYRVLERYRLSSNADGRRRRTAQPGDPRTREGTDAESRPLVSASGRVGTSACCRNHSSSSSDGGGSQPTRPSDCSGPHLCGPQSADRGT
jgi:hypothetical protein